MKADSVVGALSRRSLPVTIPQDNAGMFHIDMSTTCVVKLSLVRYSHGIVMIRIMLRTPRTAATQWYDKGRCIAPCMARKHQRTSHMRKPLPLERVCVGDRYLKNDTQQGSWKTLITIQPNEQLWSSPRSSSYRSTLLVCTRNASACHTRSTHVFISLGRVPLTLKLLFNTVPFPEAHRTLRLCLYLFDGRGTFGVAILQALKTPCGVHATAGIFAL